MSVVANAGYASLTCQSTCVLRKDGVDLGTFDWTFDNCDQNYHDVFMLYKNIANYRIDVSGVPGEINYLQLSDTTANTSAKLTTSHRSLWNNLGYIPAVELTGSGRFAVVACRTEEVVK